MVDHKEVMIEAAKSAGAIMRSYFGQQISQEMKKDRSPVTLVDKEAEKVIIDILTEVFPYNVHAEESGETNKGNDFTWVIDPLDATSNFSRGIPLFAVSIALMKGSELVEACIYHPITDEMFYASKGGGAFMNDTKLPLKVGRRDKKYILHDAMHSALKMPLWFETLGPILDMEGWYERSFGCCTLGLVYAAAGRADAFIAFGQELWDVVAGKLIAEEAGLKVTNWSGKEWQVRRDILVATPENHELLLQALDESQSERL